MRALYAAIVYVLLGMLLMWGILLTTRGSYTVLTGVALVYVLCLGAIGCLPKKSH